MNLATMTRAELEAEIITNESLYAMFDEARLLAGEYTTEEMRAIVAAWIEEGSEV